MSSKSSMSCGQVKKSNRPGKKIMKKYCGCPGEKIVHAGAVGYGNNYSDKARSAFKARHKCSTAKTCTPKHLACTQLWKKGGRATTPSKRKSPKKSPKRSPKKKSPKRSPKKKSPKRSTKKKSPKRSPKRSTKKKSPKRSPKRSTKRKSPKKKMSPMKGKKYTSPSGNVYTSCWKGYKRSGTKMKNGRKVPNCVKA